MTEVTATGGAGRRGAAGSLDGEGGVGAVTATLRLRHVLPLEDQVPVEAAAQVGRRAHVLEVVHGDDVDDGADDPGAVLQRDGLGQTDCGRWSGDHRDLARDTVRQTRVTVILLTLRCIARFVQQNN